MLIDYYEQPSIEDAEHMAWLLCVEYDNARFFKWYCGVVHEFGVAKVEYWRLSAAEARFPGKLFSQHVKEARIKDRPSNEGLRDE